MTIELADISRVFGNQKIFGGLSYGFQESNSYAVHGGNGSGKSTLLKILFGALTPSKGKLIYKNSDGSEIPLSEVPFRMSMAAPYLELIEELQAAEFLNFYTRFRQLQDGMQKEELLEIARLHEARHKEIRNFSSGMKQRLRLALAFFSKGEIILLDEPTSNLDPDGVKWYNELLSTQLGRKTIIVGSNFNKDESGLCENVLEINQYK